MATQIPSTRPTKAAKELGENIVTTDYDGTTGTSLPDSADKTHITPDEWREYAAHNNFDPDAFEARYVQSPGIWKQKTGQDRLRETRRQGCIPVNDPFMKGELVELQDLTLIAVPKAMIEEKQAEADRQTEAYSRKVEMDEYEGQFDTDDKESLKQRARRNSAANRSTGLIGETKGDPAIWYRQIPAEQREADMLRLRRGNRHVSASEAREAMADAARLGAKGTKSFNMGAGLKDGKIVR